MTDFYTVLRDSLTPLQGADAAERAKLYNRVRAVMTRQLHARIPPLAVRDINEQTAKFDAAVARLEDELTGEAARAVADDVDWAVSPAGGLFGVAVPRANPAFAGAGAAADAWNSPPIDMAWDEATEQWLDPTPEPDSPLPGRPAAEPPVARHGRQADRAPEIVVAEAPARLQGAAAGSDDHLDKELALAAGDRPRRALFRRRRDSDAMADLSPPGEETRDGTGLLAAISRHRRGASAREDAEDDETSAIAEVREKDAFSARDAWPRRVALTGVAVLALAVIGGAAFMVTPWLLPGSSAPANQPAATAGPVSPVPAPQVLANFFPAPDARSETIILYDGQNPTVFEAAPDNPVRYMRDGAGIARISSSASSAGAKAVLAPPVAQRLAGHRIRLVMEARSAVENGAAQMRLAYQKGMAVSGWQEADLPPDFSEISLVWEIPPDATGGSDYLLIQPGIPGDGTATEVKSIRIEIIG